MAPSIYASSYQRYKEDTSVFTTWLSNTAQGCGYKVQANEAATSNGSAKLHAHTHAPPSAPRLKGKHRKLAKQAANINGSPKTPAPSEELQKKYKVTVAELLRQAEAVAAWTKKTIRLPSDVEMVLKRAITAR